MIFEKRVIDISRRDDYIVGSPMKKIAGCGIPCGITAILFTVTERNGP